MYLWLVSLLIGNVGDSVAALVKGGDLEWTNTPHDCSVEGERARVEAAGCLAWKAAAGSNEGRVSLPYGMASQAAMREGQGQLTVTRSLGDYTYKNLERFSGGK